MVDPGRLSRHRPLLGRLALAAGAGVVASALVVGAAPAAVADTYSSPSTGTHSVVGAIRALPPDVYLEIRSAGWELVIT